jgi:hypothetical protein
MIRDPARESPRNIASSLVNGKAISEIDDASRVWSATSPWSVSAVIVRDTQLVYNPSSWYRHFVGSVAHSCDTTGGCIEKFPAPEQFVQMIHSAERSANTGARKCLHGDWLRKSIIIENV